MTDLDQQLASMSDTQRRLVASMMSGGSRTAVVTEAPSEGQPAVMSRAQRRLWLVNSLANGTPFNVPILHRVTGDLDVDALHVAVERLVQRHAVLRTVFPEDSSGPSQLVIDPPPKLLTRHDVTDRPEHLRYDAALSLIRAKAATGFDLRTGPVFRSAVVKVGPHDWLFLVCIHHIACDQWSMGVFMRELHVAYNIARGDTSAELPEAGPSYAQFAAEQAQLEQDGGFRSGLEYWRNRLTGLTPLWLPTDRPRPTRSAQRGAEIARWVPPALSEQIRKLAVQTGASPFMVVLAGFLVLMRTYGRTEDIAVGSTTAGRDDDTLANVMGFFVNTIVLRTKVQATSTFKDLLANVKAMVIEGHPHAAVPFELVVDSLATDRTGATSALTPVMIQQDNTPDSALQLTDLRVKLVDNFDPGTSKYDVLVSIRTRLDGTRLHIQYDTELFTPVTANKLLDGFQTCLIAAVNQPETLLADLPVIGADELAELDHRNLTTAEFDTAPTLHEAFLRTAELQPGRSAVVEANGTVRTFAEAATQAHLVAASLRRLGTERSDRVAIELPPGADYLVAALGTMLAGAAFVPIDPRYPQPRIDLIRESAEIRVTIGGRGHSIEELTGAPATVADDTDLPITTPNDPAYIIYTSGSTGDPKGVVITHRGILNNLEDLKQRLHLQPGDSVLALSSPSFDMSIFEMIGVPLAGGRAITPDWELQRDPGHWETLAVNYNVSVWNSAPALLDMFLTHLEGTGSMILPPLREAVLGGDWVPISTAKRWKNLFPDSRFHVLGGATEASIHSTFYSVDDIDPTWRSIPYGHPMANQRTIVIDDAGHLCPIGVPGDLLIGGVGLAEGYFARPDLTDERFTHLFGQRWYRTGDAARWRGDGELELLGRTDFMLKINGMRIEPGEVESAIKRLHPCDDVAVVGARDNVGDLRLVAYLKVEDAPPSTEIKSGLARLLPTYMVPSEFIALEQFPLSPNGKVDRRALAEIGVTPPAAGSPTTQAHPQTPTEQHIAAAFCEVLGIATIGRDNDFFDLGGDSFKAVRVARAISGDLPTIAIFRHPTVTALAEYVDHKLATATASRPLLVRLSGDEDQHRPKLVCVPYGGGNAVAYQPLAEALRGRLDVWAVDLPGHDLSDPALVPIREVAGRAASEIVDLQLNPVMVYGQCAGCAAAVELVRALEVREIQVAAVFVGAALPDTNPESSMEMVKDADDDLLLGHMRGLGGFDGALSDSDIEGILRVVRHDLRQMVEMYLNEAGEPPPPLNAPFHCLIGSEDPATPDYAARFNDWSRYGSSVTLSVIDGGDHYFCKHKPRELASVLLRHIPVGVRPNRVGQHE